MEKAYSVSGKIVRERLAAEDPSSKEIIAGVSKDDLVVIDGDFDHMHLVLSSLGLPFVRIDHDELPGYTFRPGQTVFVNCAASFPSGQAKKLAAFVAAGGQLITTDWALKYVLEKAFPGYVCYNQRPSVDEVIQVEIVDREDPAVGGFRDEETQPVWWLEGMSYPIRVLNRDKVKVLIRSDELKERYGEDAVLVRFEYGKGVVYHMLSHFYLQRTEVKNVVQEEKAEKYIIVKGASKNRRIMEDVKHLSYGEVQSANTSSEFIMRAVINQVRKNNRK
ncbi:MAG: hypothetical protein LBH90_03525 [Tannerella sp.]|nr:hypothetical protein [Tannerella sp.]